MVFKFHIVGFIDARQPAITGKKSFAFAIFNPLLIFTGFPLCRHFATFFPDTTSPTLIIFFSFAQITIYNIKVMKSAISAYRGILPRTIHASNSLANWSRGDLNIFSRDFCRFLTKAILWLWLEASFYILVSRCLPISTILYYWAISTYPEWVMSERTCQECFFITNPTQWILCYTLSVKAYRWREWIIDYPRGITMI